MSLSPQVRQTVVLSVVAFAGVFVAGWWILSGPARTVWEPIVASLVLAGVFSLFVLLASLFPRFVLGSWLAVGGLLFLLSFVTRGGVELGYFGSNVSSGGCITADYCSDSILVSVLLETTLFIDLVVGGALGVFFGSRYVRRVPQARYHLGAGIFFFFVGLFSAVYAVLGYAPVPVQLIMLAAFSLMGIACVVIGARYARASASSRVQRAFVALLVSSLFLLPFLIPLEGEDTGDVTLAYWVFGGFAVLAFFGLLFSKPRAKNG